MDWQMIGFAAIRVVMAFVVYLVVRAVTYHTDIDDRIYWMFAAGYMVGRIWSMIGQ